MINPQFPHGRLSKDDEGLLKIAVAADKAKGVVVVQFEKACGWFAMEKEYALALAKSIETKANEL